jgi:hypothetical protein
MRANVGALLQEGGDVDKRPTHTDGGKLSWVAYEDEPVVSIYTIEQRVELVLSEHRAFVDDHGPVAGQRVTV